MYRDTEEQLRRLQEQLLEEEEPAEEEAQLLDEDTADDWLEDSRIKDARVYQNFSNGYGKQLRNYASGYKAYNSDVTDTDLERYSEEVRQPKKPGCLGYLAAAMLILAAAVVALLWWYWKRGGIG